MFVVAGLGNPEPRYARNRHNAGFMVIEELARRAGASLSGSRFDARAARARVGRMEALLLQPMTFMNRSGGPVGAATRFFKIDPTVELLVVHDELDLELGVIRIKKGGGTAGHNGLRSIAASIGTPDFLRLRFGIGRPETGISVTSHVLSDFSAEQERDLDDVIALAADAVETVLNEGPLAAMNEFHSRKAAREQ